VGTAEDRLRSAARRAHAFPPVCLLPRENPNILGYTARYNHADDDIAQLTSKMRFLQRLAERTESAEATTERSQAPGENSLEPKRRAESFCRPVSHAGYGGHAVTMMRQHCKLGRHVPPLCQPQNVRCGHVAFLVMRLRAPRRIPLRVCRARWLLCEDLIAESHALIAEFTPFGPAMRRWI
jgi:hypothetical protein